MIRSSAWFFSFANILTLCLAIASTASRSLAQAGSNAPPNARAGAAPEQPEQGGGGPTGACCLGEGNFSCISTSQQNCALIGGLFSPGIACAAANCGFFGGCCLPDITCELRTEAQCAAEGGVYQGHGELCYELCDMLGGCCLPGGTCLASVTHNDCVAAGGIYQGTLQPCPPSCLGACCFDTGTICTNNQSETACQAAGGNWQGPGSTCATVNCRAICQIGTFQRIQSPGAQLVSSRDNAANDGFLKFDSLGGLRVLTRVYVEFGGTTIANMRLTNYGPNIVEAKAIFSEFLALKELQTIVPPPPLGIPVVDLQNELLDGCGPAGGACLGPGEHAWLAWNDPNTPEVDTAKPILFQGTPFSAEVNATDFGLFIMNGADDSFPVRVDGDSFFTVTTEGLSPVFIGPDHAEGYVKVIYEYSLVGACCHPCDGTCTPGLTAEACQASGGVFQGDVSDCFPNPCAPLGGCCIECSGECLDGTTEVECAARDGTFLGACAACSGSVCSGYADLDEDDDVGFSDLILLLNDWGGVPPAIGDLDDDGDVDFGDLLILLSCWDGE